ARRFSYPPAGPSQGRIPERAARRYSHERGARDRRSSERPKAASPRDCAEADNWKCAIRVPRGGRGMTRVNLVLLCALIACALSLVTSRDQARRVFVELERAQAEARGYETEYGQLQLEPSTWGMPAAGAKTAP